MPSKADKNNTHMTLSELAALVRRTVESISDDVWVVAELAEANVNKLSGHCYLTLVEKKGETTVAQMRANIWAGVYKRIAMLFKGTTGSELSKGMKVLMRGSLGYHEVYGLSLNVREIDPRYTLGEMALKRKETLERLKKEGVIDLNRELAFPAVPQRIALVASGTSAGYGDFIDRMTGNPFGYAYDITLFNATMQGDSAEGSIVEALGMIIKERKLFDVIVLIRGGGSQVDLSCFDSYGLALAIARCPLPVLAGIGHERDETVADRVAYRRLITPSAVAEFIVTCARRFEDKLEELRERLVSRATGLVGYERHRLMMAGRTMLSATRALMGAEQHRITSSAGRFTHAARQGLQRSSAQMQQIAAALHGGARMLARGASDMLVSIGARLRTGTVVRLRGEPPVLDSITDRLLRLPAQALKRKGRVLETMEAKARLLDPANVLRRGYSITLLDGRVLKVASTLEPGQTIKTRLYQGGLVSRVEEVIDDMETNTDKDKEDGNAQEGTDVFKGHAGA